MASLGTGNTTAGETEWSSTSVANFTHATDRLRPLGVVSGRFTGSGHLTSTAFNLPQAFGRIYFQFDAAPSTAFYIVRFINVGGTSDLIGLRLNTDRTVTLVEGATPTVLTSLPALATDTWHLIELYADVTSSVWSPRINQTIAARVPFARTTTGNIGYWSLGPVAVNPGTTIWYADPAVNNTTGPHNCSWCGPCAGVYMVKPTADHVTSGWTSQTGGALYAEIDDLPGTIDTTTYIKETTGTAGAQAGFYLTSPPVAGLVTAVQAGVRGNGTATSPDRRACLMWQDANNYSVSGLNVNWNSTTWTTVYPALTLEETWDGVPRPLTTDYLFGPSYQPYPPGGPWTASAPAGSRFASVRAVRTEGSGGGGGFGLDGFGGYAFGAPSGTGGQINWSAIWATVEIGMPYAQVRYDRPAPRVLVDLDVP